MSVEFNKTSEIITRLKLEPNGFWHNRLASMCMKRMDKYVPMEETGKHRGMLRRLAHIEQVGDELDIVYPGPYAHYMYEGKVYVDPLYNVAGFPIRNGKISFNPEDGAIEGFVSRKDVTKIPTNRDIKYHTPGTGPHWDRRMVSAEMQDIERAIERQMEWVNNKL